MTHVDTAMKTAAPGGASGVSSVSSGAGGVASEFYLADGDEGLADAIEEEPQPELLKETRVLNVTNDTSEPRPAPSLPPSQPVVIVEQSEGFALLSWQLIIAFLVGGVFVLVVLLLQAVVANRK